LSRTLLKRATDAQTRYERAELAAADKRTLRDKAIREARAEHPAAHIAQATGLSRERVRQITKLTLALLAVLAVTVGKP
jgi:DNA-directed RNA polymerase sigma subunit (sigma70/sigma32)